MNKNSILIVVMILFFAASGFLLYRNFYSTPSFVPGRGFTGADSGIDELNVQVLDKQVDTVSRSLDADGIWSTIDSNTTFQGLDGSSLIEVEYEGYQTRPNPFLPIEFEFEGQEEEQ